MTTPDPLAGMPTIWLPVQPPRRTPEENQADAEDVLTHALQRATRLIRDGKTLAPRIVIHEALVAADRILS